MEVENKEKDIFILEWPPLREVENKEKANHPRMTPLREVENKEKPTLQSS